MRLLLLFPLPRKAHSRHSIGNDNRRVIHFPLSKNMFSMNASKRIIISTLKEDTTSINYRVAQRWEKDCICGSVPPSLEDFCEK